MLYIPRGTACRAKKDQMANHIQARLARQHAAFEILGVPTGSMAAFLPDLVRSVGISA